MYTYSFRRGLLILNTMVVILMLPLYKCMDAPNPNLQPRNLQPLHHTGWGTGGWAPTLESSTPTSYTLRLLAPNQTLSRSGDGRVRHVRLQPFSTRFRGWRLKVSGLKATSDPETLTPTPYTLHPRTCTPHPE